MGYQKRVMTDSARHVLEQIAARAVDRGLPWLDKATVPRLAIWSVLNWERKLGRCAIEAVTSDVRSLESDIDELLSASSTLIMSTLKSADALVRPTDDQSTLFDELLDHAGREAELLGHGYVGTEHLVLAVVAHADEQLDAVFRRNSVRYESVKDAVINALLEPPPSS